MILMTTHSETIVDELMRGRLGILWVEGDHAHFHPDGRVMIHTGLSEWVTLPVNWKGEHPVNVYVNPETLQFVSRIKKAVAILKNIENEESGITGLCLHPVDLASSKLLAGRDKDFSFVSGMLQNQIVRNSDIRSVLQELPAYLAERLAENLQLCLARSTVIDDTSVPRDNTRRKPLENNGGGIGC